MHLNIFTNLFIVAVRYTHIYTCYVLHTYQHMLCIAGIVDCTQVAHFKIIKTYHILSYC